MTNHQDKELSGESLAILNMHSVTWKAIVAVLDEVMPEWLQPKGSAKDCAVNAIRALATSPQLPVAQMSGDVEFDESDFGSASLLWQNIDLWFHAEPGESSGVRAEQVESHIKYLISKYAARRASQPSNALPQTLTEADRARIMALADPYRVEGYLSSQKHYGFSYAQLLCFVMSLASHPSNAAGQDARQKSIGRIAIDPSTKRRSVILWNGTEELQEFQLVYAAPSAVTAPVPPVVQAPSDEKIREMVLDICNEQFGVDGLEGYDEADGRFYRAFADRLLTTTSNAGEAKQGEKS